MKEFFRKAIEILDSKSCGSISLEDIKNWLDWFRRRTIEVLSNKRGELGIPKDKVEAIAETILPDIVAFFQTEEGKKVFAEWQKEQEIKKLQSESNTKEGEI